MGVQRNHSSPLAPALKEADNGRTHARQQPLASGGVVHNLGAIERRAQHGRLGHLAAIATTDAGVIDRGNRVLLQRIACFLHSERRTARESDAGVIPCTNIFVYAEAGAHYPLATLDRLSLQRLLTPL